MRFVVFSFLILGWVFWELSGGADFEPPSAARPQPADQIAVSPEPVHPDPAQPVETPQLAHLTPVAATAIPAPRPEATPGRTGLRFDLSPAVAGDASAPVALASLASLEQGGAQFATLQADGIIPVPGPAPVALAPVGNAEPDAPATDTAAPVLDIRGVSGRRVNMRSGPGVRYPVISSLSRGEQVEVLNDPGNGWLKLRPIEGGPTGWMAASLVSRR